LSIFKFKKNQYKNGVDYDKTRDYSEEMLEAKKNGDTELLARLEDERNKKIEGENMPYRKTYDYVDIGTQIEAGIRDGESPSRIKELVDARREKATKNKKYDAYKNDDIQKRGLKYYYDEESGAGYGYQNRPEKDDSFEEDVRNLLARVSAKDNFEYDLEEDEAYQTVKSQIANEAQRASTDVIANIGASSGGKSSYAVSAAMQAANNANAKLAEQIPKFYEIAYKRYQDSRSNDVKALEMALSAAEYKQDEYAKDMEQYNRDRSFAAESYENAIDRMEKEDKNMYEQEKDARDFEYKKQQDSADAEFKERELAIKADDVSFKWAKENMGFQYKAMEAARKLVQHYEENGIESPDELLELAQMLEFKELNQMGAAYYLSKQSGQASAQARKQPKSTLKSTSQGSSKSSSKTNSSKSSSKKTDSDSEKTVANDINLDNVTIKNQKSGDGYFVGQSVLNYDKIKSGVKNGSLVCRENPDGTVTISKK